MPINHEPIIISFYSHKGGVGKTSSVLNIATILTKVLKYRVLVVDADPQCSLSALMLKHKAKVANIATQRDAQTASTRVADNANEAEPIDGNDDAIFRYIDENYENNGKNKDRLNIFEVFKSMCEDEDDEETDPSNEDVVLAEAIKNTVLETPDDNNPNLKLLVGSNQLHKLGTTLSYGTFTQELRRYKGLGAELCNQIRDLAKGGSKQARTPDVQAAQAAQSQVPAEPAADSFKADIILIDLNPGSTLLNAALLLGSDYFVVPVMADHFSCQAIVSLSNIIPDWEKAIRDSKNRTTLDANNAKLTFHSRRFPSRQPHFLGLIPQRIKSRKASGDNNHLKTKPNEAHQYWLDKIYQQLDSGFREKLSLCNMLPENFKIYSNNFIPTVWSIIIDNPENRSGSIYDLFYGPKRFGEGHKYLQRALHGYYKTIVALFSNMRPHDMAYLDLNKKIEEIEPRLSKDKELFESAKQELTPAPKPTVKRTRLSLSQDSHFEVYLKDPTFRLNFLIELFKLNMVIIRRADSQQVLHTFYSNINQIASNVIERAKVFVNNLDSLNKSLLFQMPEDLLSDVREALHELTDTAGIIDSSPEEIAQQMQVLSNLSEHLGKNYRHPDLEKYGKDKNLISKFHERLRAIFNCLSQVKKLIDEQITALSQDYDLFKSFASSQLDNASITITRAPPSVTINLTERSQLLILLDPGFKVSVTDETTFIYSQSPDETNWLTANECVSEQLRNNRTLQIALFNHKGGVAKTTTCQNLAYLLGLQGLRVMVVDTDTQCNLSSLLMGDLYRKFYDQLAREHQRLVSTSNNASQQVTRFRQTYDFLHYTLNNPTSEDFFTTHADAISIFAVPPPYQNVFLVPGSTFRFVDVELRISTMLEKRPSDPTHRAPFQAAANIFRALGRKFGMDIVLFDMCPTISATNALFLMNSDYFIIPTLPDFMSLQGVQSLPHLLRTWANKIYRFQGLRTVSATFSFPTLLQVLPNRCAVDYRNRTKNGLTTGHSAAIKSIYDYVNNRFKNQLFTTKKLRQKQDQQQDQQAHTETSIEYTAALQKVCQRISGDAKLPILDGIIDYDSFGAVLQINGTPLTVLPSLSRQIGENEILTETMKGNIDKARKFQRRFYQLIADIIPVINSDQSLQTARSRTEPMQLVGLQIYRCQTSMVEFMYALSRTPAKWTELLALRKKLETFNKFLLKMKLGDDRAPNFKLNAFSDFNGSYPGTAYDNLSRTIPETTNVKLPFMTTLKKIVMNIAALEYHFHTDSVFYNKNKKSYLNTLELIRQAAESLEKTCDFDPALFERQESQIHRNAPLVPESPNLNEAEHSYSFFEAVFMARYNSSPENIPFTILKDTIKLDPSELTVKFNSFVNYASMVAWLNSVFNQEANISELLTLFSKFLNGAIIIFTKDGVITSDNYPAAENHFYFVQHGTQLARIKIIDNLPAHILAQERENIREFIANNLKIVQEAQAIGAISRADLSSDDGSQHHERVTSSRPKRSLLPTDTNADSDEDASDDEHVLKRSRRRVSTGRFGLFQPKPQPSDHISVTTVSTTSRPNQNVTEANTTSADPDAMLDMLTQGTKRRR